MTVTEPALEGEVCLVPALLVLDEPEPLEPPVDDAVPLLGGTVAVGSACAVVDADAPDPTSAIEGWTMAEEATASAACWNASKVLVPLKGALMELHERAQSQRVSVNWKRSGARVPNHAGVAVGLGRRLGAVEPDGCRGPPSQSAYRVRR